MYNYRLNQEMNEVKAIYFDGTPFGVNRIKDFIVEDRIDTYIDGVRTVMSPAADENNWADSIKGCIAELELHPHADVDNPGIIVRVYPGDMLIVKRYPIISDAEYRLKIITMPMTAFSALYKSVDE